MIRLLAIDLDGTLLKRDGTLDSRDMDAIEEARRSGMEIALATGRLIPGTAPVALQLGLTAPMVCADGATLSKHDGSILAESTMGAPLWRRLVEVMETVGLQPFVFDHHRVHGRERHEAIAFHTNPWSPDLRLRAGFPEEATSTMVLGLGTEAMVASARTLLEAEHGPDVDLVHFGFRTGTWAVRILKKGVHKGSGVRQLGAHLGIATSEIAVIGDWLNDVPMFRVAARSFVMTGAPSEVAAEATDRLASETGHGGGVAEALALLFEARSDAG